MRTVITVIDHHIFKGAMGGVGFMATHQKGDSFIRIATSVCSTDDQYVKKISNDNMVNAMEKGECIKLPIPADTRYKMTHKKLRLLIGDLFWF